MSSVDLKIKTTCSVVYSKCHSLLRVDLHIFNPVKCRCVVSATPRNLFFTALINPKHYITKKIDTYEDDTR